MKRQRVPARHQGRRSGSLRSRQERMAHLSALAFRSCSHSPFLRVLRRGKNARLRKNGRNGNVKRVAVFPACLRHFANVWQISCDFANVWQNVSRARQWILPMFGKIPRICQTLAKTEKRAADGFPGKKNAGRFGAARALRMADVFSGRGLSRGALPARRALPRAPSAACRRISRSAPGCRECPRPTRRGRG